MENFAGGGHLNSAGAQVDDSPENVISQVKEVVDKYLDEQNKMKEKEEEDQ